MTVGWIARIEVTFGSGPAQAASNRAIVVKPDTAIKVIRMASPELGSIVTITPA
jgi:hypothetical protein